MFMPKVNYNEIGSLPKKIKTGLPNCCFRLFGLLVIFLLCNCLYEAV